MRTTLLYSMFFLAIPLMAQRPEERRTAFLQNIEKNNTTLVALRQQVVADKAQNRIGNALPDPTFGFSYSWGNQEGMEGKKTFSAEQTLDLGVLSGQRKKAVAAENAVVDGNYLLERQTILAEADLLLVQLIYENAVCEEWSARMERALQLKDLYENKLKAGDVNQIEVNKIRLYYTAALANYRKAEADRKMTIDQLRRMNGDQPVNCGYTQYGPIQLPELRELESKVQELSPQIKQAYAKVQKEKDNLKLSKIEGLPEISVGYTGEHVGGNNYNGVSVGVSLPIWGNTRRKVSQQRTAVLAADMNLKDVETQTVARLKLQYENARRLIEVALQFTESINKNEDLEILRKALDLGQMSLLEYLTEVSYYDDLHLQAIEVERDSQIALSKLYSIFN